MMLLPEGRNTAADNKRVVGFALRTFGLGILMLLPMLAAFAASFSSPNGIASLGSSEWPLITNVGLICAIGFLMVFGLHGTLRPAYVAGGNRGFDTTFSRGRSQFLWTVAHLTIGPVLLFTISLGITVGGLSLLEPSIAMLSARYYPNIPVFALLILAYLLQALGYRDDGLGSFHCVFTLRKPGIEQIKLGSGPVTGNTGRSGY